MTCCIVNMLNQVRHWIKLFSQLKNKRTFLSSFNELGNNFSLARREEEVKSVLPENWIRNTKERERDRCSVFENF